MRKKISKTIKEKVAKHADYICEYCLLSEKVSFYKFHLEHIRSLKHGGSSELSNLAYCCPDCNTFKGSDIATFSDNEDTIVRFYNPRKDSWEEHFEIQDGAIYGKTTIGEATVRIFRFNEVERIIFRQQLIYMGLYP